ncbi:MAG: asparaginase [Deltaproteobacteria bacterium]|nr:asparaginase [Deltaproteobacteria bacterium]
MKTIIFFSSLAFALLLSIYFAHIPNAAESPDLKIHVTDPKLPSVAIVTTGGTIAEKADPKTGKSVPAVSGEELVKAVPGLEKIANIGVLNFMNIDSSQMTPEVWLKLSKKVNDIIKRPDITGVVVTHGTDTMAEAAYFLELTVDSHKPVVFTGAMKDASAPCSDGPGNILNAVIQASSKKARGWGVTVTLNNYVNGARNVRKTQTTNVQTFESGEKGYLGYVYNGKVTRFNNRLHNIKLPLPSTLPKVVFFSTYAGDNGDFIRYAVDKGAKGLVIDGLGAGNVNVKTCKAILYALSKNVPVVVSTRVYYGSVEPAYGDEGGGGMLEKKGVILAGDLMGTKARLLLMLALAEVGNNREDLRRYFE